MTILGKRPDDTGADDRPLRPRDAERILAGQLLTEVRLMRAQFTALAAELQGRVTNDVLAVATRVFDASGYVAEQFRVAAGSISVDAGAHAVTVAAAGPSSAAPAVGTGVYVVPANTHRTIPLASRQVTLYGTSGDSISYAVFAGAVSPVAG